MAAIFVFAQVVRIQYAEQSAVILMLPTIILTTFGPEITRRLLFPSLIQRFGIKRIPV